MPSTQEKLNQIKRLRDPNYSTAELLGKVMGQVQLIKGDDGYTPVKGKDYWTNDEIEQVIAYIEGRIRVPEDGKDGKDGARGDTGERGPKGEKGDSIKGEKGERGERGADGRDAKPADMKKLVADSVKALLSTDEWKVMEKKALYNKFDQRWHGGGSSSGTASIFIDDEIVGGSGTSWTITDTPISGSLKLYALGQRLKLTTDYSIVGTAITTVLSWSAGDLLADYRTN